MSEHDDRRPDLPDEDVSDALRAAFDARAEADSVLSTLSASPIRLRGAEVEPAQSRTGRYRVVGEIARGGVGIVYKGRDVDLGRDVAMKVMADGHVQNAEITERFIEEAQIGGQLQHPGIVPVYELGLDDQQRPYFAMKLVKGKTLSALLSERASPEESQRRFLGIFEQVCETIGYAHDRGVIHRDLKPANVMVGAFGEVQVVDWGFAKVLGQGGIADERRTMMRAPDVSVIATMRSKGEGSESIAGSVMGTPAYMPPEQALGDVDALDERSDVFSLGAILVEVLLGRPLYTKESGDNLIVQAVHCRTDAVFEALADRDVDPALVELIRRCLEPRQSKRPKSAMEVSNAISAHLAGVEQRAQEGRVAAATARVQTEAERKKRKLSFSLAAAAVALIAVGGGLVWWAQRGASERDASRRVALHAALEEASFLAGQGRAPAALEAARRALDLGGGVGANELVASLEEEAAAARLDAEETAKEKALFAVDDRLRSELAEMMGLAEVVRIESEYAAAFQAYGLELGTTDEDGFVKRLHARPEEVRRTLAGVLYLWGRMYSQAAPARAAILPRAIQLGMRIDPIAKRARFQELSGRRDWAGIREMEASFDPTVDPIEVGLVLMAFAQKRERYVDAERIGRLCERHYPPNFLVQFNLAFLPISKASPYRQLGQFRSALALAPGSRRLKEKVALQLSTLGRNEEALGELEAIVADGRALTYLHKTRAEILAAMGRKEEALATLKKARERTADRKFDQTDLAMAEERIYTQLGEPKKALAAARRAIERYPERHFGYCAAGSACLRLRLLAEAEAYFQKAVELAPQMPIYHLNLALVLATRHKFEPAEAAAREALRLYPDNPQNHAALAGVLSTTGRYDESIRHHLKAVRLSQGWHLPREIWLQIRGGAVGTLSNSGRMEQAIRLSHEHEWRGDFEPPHTPYSPGLEVLGNHGVTLHLLGAERDALPYLELATQHRPEFHGHLFSVQESLAFEKKLAIALAANGKPESPVEAGNCGAIAYQKGYFAGALRLYRRSITERDPSKGHPSVPVIVWINAARSAVRAAAWDDLPADRPAEAARPGLRADALDWLRRAHQMLALNLTTTNGLVISTSRAAVNRILRDHAYDSVRHAEALAKLPPEEQKAWRELWSEFEELSK